MFVRCVLLSLGALLIACGGKPAIIGTVLDADGQPLAGAEVRTDPPTDLRQSNPKGQFFIDGVLGDDATPAPLPAGTYRLIVTKLPGYEGTEQTIRVEGETRVTVRLEEKQADIGPPVSPKPTPTDPKDHTKPDIPVGGN